MDLGFTIHTERHQFYWDRHTMWQDTFSNQLDRIFKLKRELNGGSKMPRNLNFLKTKMDLGFTIHTERHQFYWDRHTMWQDTFSNQLDRIFKLKRELNGGSKMPRNLMLKLDNSILCHNYFWKSCCFELAKNCTFEDGEPLILDWVLVKLQLNSDRAQF